MKKNTKLSYNLVLFISILSIIFFAYLYNLYQSKEGFSVNNELVSSLKESLNNIFNPIKICNRSNTTLNKVLFIFPISTAPVTPPIKAPTAIGIKNGK